MRRAAFCPAALVCALFAAGPATAQARRGTPPVRATVTVLVTDMQGSPMAGVDVSATGPMKRAGTTDEKGTLVLRNVAPGDYRLRFEHEGNITLERDITVEKRAINVTAALDEAPPAPAPAAAPEPAPTERAPAPAGPPAQPSSTPIPDFVEHHYIGNAPSMTSRVGCASTATANVLQIRDPLPQHAHADADEMLYVVAGEGTEQIAGRTVALAPGTFAVVPRGTPHALARRGSRPLILLSILTGPPCTAEQ